MSAPEYTHDFAAVLAAERERIDRLRAARGTGPRPIVGLALSGGGIRSASFGLGVLQTLAACGLSRSLDYVSTVSGGSYAGTALTWLMRDGSTAFPFAAGDHRTPLGRLRRQVGDLRPTARLTGRALVAAVLQHAVVSLLVYGGLLVGFFFLLDVVDQALRPLRAVAAIYAAGPWKDRIVLDLNLLLLMSAACLLLFLSQAVVPSVSHAVASRRAGDPKAQARAYVRRRRAVRRAGALLQAMLVTFVLGTVPLVSRALAGWDVHPWARGAIAGGLIVAAGFAAARSGSRGAAAGSAARAVMPFVAFGLLYGLLLLTHRAAIGIVLGSAPWTIWVVAGGALVLGAVTSLDVHGSACVYRDRLAEAFMPDARALGDPHERPARAAASYPLASACGPDTAGPYHLLNAALLTTASRLTRRRQRGADAFVFSPLYCGSDATGWRATQSWKHGTTTLACAMATSAAALDPYAAMAGRGATRGSLMSLLWALLGLRLGHVAPNPAREPPRHRPRLSPNLLVPGIAQALFGDARESSPYVTLADGGDFDDLGIYELVRRRLDVIVAVDATEDGACTFGALGNVVERVRTDFGVEITFDDLGGLRPAATTDGVPPASRRAHAVGRISYPGDEDRAPVEGVIVYLKAAMLDGTPPDVVAHARTRPGFPHQSTLDPFFDEGTFEAYRGLGALAAQRMLDDPGVALGLAPRGAHVP